MGRFSAPKRVQYCRPGSDGMLDSLAAAAHSTTWLLYSAQLKTSPASGAA